MKIEFRKFHGPSDWGWVQQQVPILRCEDTNGIMAIDIERNETVGAVIFDNWTRNAVTAHIMVSNPMVFRHGFLEECFDFAFNHCDRKYMMGQLRSDNEKAYKLDMKMGFKEVLRIKDGFEDGVDCVIIQMHRDDCRFINRDRQGVINE